jgi:hypothetical protein
MQDDVAHLNILLSVKPSTLLAAPSPAQDAQLYGYLAEAGKGSAKKKAAQSTFISEEGDLRRFFLC